VADNGFAIAASGLEADRAAMDTIANNLSNVNTPGYASESPVLTTTAAGDVLGVGAGVTVLNVSQANDAVLAADNLAASASAAGSSALQQTLTSIQGIFPEPGANGLSAQLSTFWSSWDAIATNPSETAPRTEVINQAENIATTLNQATAQLTQTSNDTSTEIASNVGQVNTLLGQVAALNQSIVATVASGGQPNSLVDQRNNLVSQLGQDIGITTVGQSDGSLNVYVGGVQLVQGSTSDSLTMKSAGSPATVSIVSNNTGAAVPVSSGTLAGLLTAVNVSIPGYQSQLNTVANDLASTVNGALGQGYDATGNTDVAAGTGVGPNNSAALFVIGNASGAAATIGVNQAVVGNPALLAAASTSTNGANDGSNAQVLAELGSAAGGPDQTYQTFVTNLGSQVQTVTSQAQAQQSLSQSLSASLSSVTGVNTDQQTVDMLGYQQAYQASAKVISTIDQMVQSLLAAV
jgi:flagellar hook-associated protein 1 FlgK